MGGGVVVCGGAVARTRVFSVNTRVCVHAPPHRGTRRGPQERFLCHQTRRAMECGARAIKSRARAMKNGVRVMRSGPRVVAPQNRAAARCRPSPNRGGSGFGGRARARFAITRREIRDFTPSWSSPAPQDGDLSPCWSNLQTSWSSLAPYWSPLATSWSSPASPASEDWRPSPCGSSLLAARSRPRAAGTRRRSPVEGRVDVKGKKAKGRTRRKTEAMLPGGRTRRRRQS